MGRRHATAKSLAPWDSASCLKPLGLVDEGRGDDEGKPFVDDEDEEFFEGLKQWVSNVCTATHPDGSSDSEATMVGAAAGACSPRVLIRRR